MTLATPAIPPLLLSPHHTALLIQDMQCNLVHPEYGLGQVSATRGVSLEFEEYFHQLHRVVGNIGLLRKAAMAHGIMVVYTGLAQPPDGAPSSLQRALGLCAPQGDDQSQILPGLAPDPPQRIFYRRGFNAFHETALLAFLRDGGITNLLVTGVITEFGIRATAGSAQDLGFGPLIVSDATASLTQATQTRTLQEMAYGLTKVRSTGELLTYLDEMAEQDGKWV